MGRDATAEPDPPFVPFRVHESRRVLVAFAVGAVITGIAGWLSGTVTDDRYATFFGLVLVVAGVVGFVDALSRLFVPRLIVDDGGISGSSVGIAVVKLPWGFLTSADLSPLLGAMILRVPDSGGKWLAKTMSVAPADVDRLAAVLEARGVTVTRGQRPPRQKPSVPT